MKSTTYINTLIALGLAATVSAQDELQNEQSGVCGFTLRAGDADVFRNNDFTLSNTNSNGYQLAQFYITSNDTGRMYGGTGERCGFDPYLECDDDTDDEQDRSPFVIADNSSLTFNGQATFYLCDRNSFVSTDPDDQDDAEDRNNPDDLQTYPYIYPPIGTTNNTPRNYENCTAVELTASGCEENSNNAFTVSPSAALQTPNPTGSGTPASTGSVTGTATNSGGNAATTSANAQNAAGHVGLDSVLVTAGVFVAAMGFAWI